LETLAGNREAVGGQRVGGINMLSINTKKKYRE